MRKLLTSLIFMLVTAVWAGDFEDGMAASKMGDNKTAFSLFKKLLSKWTLLLNSTWAWCMTTGQES